jgi:hypothetical protein
MLRRLKRAIVAAYDRLLGAVERTPGLDSAGTLVKKVPIEAIRNEVIARGWLETKEKSGGMTGAARVLFHRAKTDLIDSGQYIEKDGLFWKLATNIVKLRADEPF